MIDYQFFFLGLAIMGAFGVVIGFIGTELIKPKAKPKKNKPVNHDWIEPKELWLGSVDFK